MHILGHFELFLKRANFWSCVCRYKIFFSLLPNHYFINFIKACQNRRYTRYLRYSVFHRFRQAKFDYGGSILSSSQVLQLPQLPQKVELTSKVVKVDSKIIISLPEIYIRETRCIIEQNFICDNDLIVLRAFFPILLINFWIRVFIFFGNAKFKMHRDPRRQRCWWWCKMSATTEDLHLEKIFVIIEPLNYFNLLKFIISII